MDVREAIHAELSRLLRAHGLDDPHISADDALTGTLGLSSLEVAGLVPRLNATLDADPFSAALAVTDMRTVSDLVRAYESTRSRAADVPAETALLQDVARRAETRRRRSRGS